jgi:hypothetical protein
MLDFKVNLMGQKKHGHGRPFLLAFAPKIDLGIVVANACTILKRLIRNASY